jgi:hypothetical protein
MAPCFPRRVPFPTYNLGSVYLITGSASIASVVKLGESKQCSGARSRCNSDIKPRCQRHRQPASHQRSTQRQPELNAQPGFKADLVPGEADSRSILQFMKPPWDTESLLGSLLDRRDMKEKLPSMQREQHSGREPAGKAPSCPHNGGGVY